MFAWTKKEVSSGGFLYKSYEIPFDISLAVEGDGYWKHVFHSLTEIDEHETILKYGQCTLSIRQSYPNR